MDNNNKHENGQGEFACPITNSGGEIKRTKSHNDSTSNVIITTNTIIKNIPDINAAPGFNLHSGLGCPRASQPKWGPPCSVHNESGFSLSRESNISMPRIEVNISSGARRSLAQLFNKKFDEITKNESRLLQHDYIKVSMNKKNYYLIKHTEKCDKIFVTQENLKVYMKIKFGIIMVRSPDEAYITIPSDGSKIHIKILEKKELNLMGSIESKLFTGPSFKREYNLVLGDRFIVYYAFCVNSFLQKKIESIDKKYVILKQILNENEISVFFGNEWNYFAKLDVWLHSS